MTQIVKVRRPTVNQIRRLSKCTIELEDLHQRRRAEALILYGMGLTPLEIAGSQAVHANTVYKDLHAFEKLGLEAVAQLHSSGAPRRIPTSQIPEMVRLAEQSPQAVGLPYGRWSLRKLSVYLVKKHIVKSIGHERLRQLLKKRCAFPAGATQVAQPGPTATRNSGSAALDFQACAHRWASLVLRCQTHRGESLRGAALYLGQASSAVAQPKDTWALLSLPEL